MGRAGAIRLAKLGGLGVLFVFLVFLWYAKDLPSPGKINARVSAQTTKFYDRSEKHLLYELYGDKNRSLIEFNEMPNTIKHATVAIEDKDFYKHGAFSVFGIGRAVQGVILRDRSKGGGSTITQQYVKNALLTNEYSYSRKIKELILAIEIEQFYSKDDILKLYLNEIPYGNRAYGIESACKTYFPQNIDKDSKDQRCAKNLSIGQAALLAAVPNRPTYYNPYGANQPKLLDRQHMILDLMAEQGYITKQQAEDNKWDLAKLQAERNPVQNLYGNLDPKVAHFVLYAQDYLENKYGNKAVTEGGLKVITSMDFDKQMAAYDAINGNKSKGIPDAMANVRRNKGSNAALVSTDPKSGQILAMIGSYDFNDPKFGNFNVATAARQPGSSFKPIVYSALIGRNKDAACAKTRECPTYGPGTVLYDVPTNFGTEANPYKPQNYGNKTYTYTTVRSALAGSLNVPAVKSLYMTGVSNSLKLAEDMGITTLDRGASNYGLSLVLGSGEVRLTEMANAYESFANGGLHYQQSPVVKVFDQKSGVLEDNSKPSKPKQVLDEQVAYLTADVLSDNNAKRYVFNNILDIANGCPANQATNCIHAGVKTGTTEHFNDAWTVGFTPDMTAGVWVGNNDNAPMSDAAAAIAAPIWRSYMNAVHRAEGKTKTEAFKRPAEIKTVTLDKKTGRAVTEATAEGDKYTDVFPSWYVPMTSVGGRSAEIDKVSGKLATQCTPPLARQTAYSSAVVPEISSKDPAYSQWFSAMQARGIATSGTTLPTESDNVHECEDIRPKVTVSGATGGGPTYHLNVQVTLGTFGTTKPGAGSAQLQVYFDDQIVSTQQISASGTYPVTYSPTTTGSHVFKAVITDTGLYQASDDATVNVTETGGGGDDFEGLNPDNNDQVTAGAITFAWTPSDGATLYTLYIDGSPHVSTASTSVAFPVLSKGTHTWYVRDNNNKQTSPITFKVK